MSEVWVKKLTDRSWAAAFSRAAAPWRASAKRSCWSSSVYSPVSRPATTSAPETEPRRMGAARNPGWRVRIWSQRGE